MLPIPPQNLTIGKMWHREIQKCNSLTSLFAADALARACTEDDIGLACMCCNKVNMMYRASGLQLLHREKFSSSPQAEYLEE